MRSISTVEVARNFRSCQRASFIRSCFGIENGKADLLICFLCVYEVVEGKEDAGYISDPFDSYRHGSRETRILVNPKSDRSQRTLSTYHSDCYPSSAKVVFRILQDDLFICAPREQLRLNAYQSSQWFWSYTSGQLNTIKK